MPAPRRVDVERVLELQREGLTHQEIADRLCQETGERISRVAVSVALHRSGHSEEQPRYDDLIPWRVRMPHMRQYPALMLRAFGRRRAGHELPADLDRKLNLWLARLQEEGTVVDYSPDEGFVYVSRNGDRPGSLIRKPTKAKHR